MIPVWLNMHNVRVTAALAFFGCVVLAFAGSTELAMPQQPVLLAWPVATIALSGSAVVFDTGVGDLRLAATRTLSDRIPTLVLALAFNGPIVAVAATTNVRNLVSWCVSVIAVSVGLVMLRNRDGLMITMVLGLLTIALEFTTPLAPITRAFERPYATVACVVALILASTAYVLAPLVKQRP